MKTAVDVTIAALYRLTIRIRSHNTIHPNMNTLFGPLFGTEANTKRIFGTPLIDTQTYLVQSIISNPSFIHVCSHSTEYRWRGGIDYKIVHELQKADTHYKRACGLA